MDILIPQFQQTNYYFLDTIKHIVNAQFEPMTVTREVTQFVSMRKNTKVIKMQVFNIAINNIEYSISQLVYISSSVATSINLFKNSKMRDSIAVLITYPNQIVNQAFL